MIKVKEGKQNLQSLLSEKRIVPQTKKNKISIKKFSLSDSEKKIYGNRTPAGYEKIDVLGRGG